MKTISSPLLFKQIIGRGSRIDKAIDFTGVTRLFDEWDRPGQRLTERPQGPFAASLCGRVFHAQTGQVIVGARVSVRTGPNTQQGPIRADKDGSFRFEKLPAGTVTLIVSAPGFVRRELKMETLADQPVDIDVPLKPERKGARKIKVVGLTVEIADEAIFLVESTGQQLTLEQYRDYARQKIIQAAPSRKTLREIWVKPESASVS